MASLTDDHRQILRYLMTHISEGAQDTVWIAEGCDHWYDTPWASSRLATLKRRGLVENKVRGSWSITDAGKEVLA